MAGKDEKGVRKEERLAAGFKTEDIIREVKVARELDATYRVLEKQFLFDSRHHSQESAQAHFEKVYAGRLYAKGDSLPDGTIAEDDDWKIVKDEWSTTGDYILWTRRWNAVAEWKTEEYALQEGERRTKEGRIVEVVPRNSRKEHQLTQYGILKIVRPKQARDA